MTLHILLSGIKYTNIFLLAITLLSNHWLNNYEQTAENCQILYTNFHILFKNILQKIPRKFVSTLVLSLALGKFYLCQVLFYKVLTRNFEKINSCAKTTNKLLWNSENVTNITKALIKRNEVKQKTNLDLIGKFASVGKMMLYDISEGWLNPCSMLPSYSRCK